MPGPWPGPQGLTSAQGNRCTATDLQPCLSKMSMQSCATLAIISTCERRQLQSSSVAFLLDPERDRERLDRRLWGLCKSPTSAVVVLFAAACLTGPPSAAFVQACRSSNLQAGHDQRLIWRKERVGQWLVQVRLSSTARQR